MVSQRGKTENEWHSTALIYIFGKSASRVGFLHLVRLVVLVHVESRRNQHAEALERETNACGKDELQWDGK